MSKFLRKLLLFTLPVIVLAIIKKAVTPYYFGDDLHAQKLAFFQQNQGLYNTVLFGSSRVYRHINPAVFDATLSEYGVGAFNFATPSTMNPESYYLYEKFLEELKPGQIRYAVLEAHVLIKLSQNATTTKGSYWNTLKNLSYSLQYLHASSFSASEKWYSTANYLRSFLYGLVDFGMLNPQRRARHREQQLPHHQAGYLALEDELQQLGAASMRSQRRAKFQNDTSRLATRIRAAKNQEAYEQKRGQYNAIHLDRLQRLLLLSEAKGVELFFLLPPRLKEADYEELVPLLMEFPPERVLSMYEYPENALFYSTVYSFDIGHFNKQGADLFTRKLAELMIER
ncbi:MAG: hypothetical protein AAFN81_25695, partial [Bacteroidota bacterium]